MICFRKTEPTPPELVRAFSQLRRILAPLSREQALRVLRGACDELGIRHEIDGSTFRVLER